jgi:hypothetical protein
MSSDIDRYIYSYGRDTRPHMPANIGQYVDVNVSFSKDIYVENKIMYLQVHQLIKSMHNVL